MTPPASAASRHRWRGTDPAVRRAWAEEDEAEARRRTAETLLGATRRPVTCDACGRPYPAHLVVPQVRENVCRPCLHLRGTA